MIKQSQRYTSDCCLAASASLMDKLYDDVFTLEFQKYIEEEKKGTYGDDVYRVFELVGLAKEDYKTVINYMGQGEEGEGWSAKIRNSSITSMLWGRRALIQVPSLNTKGKSHLIAWNYDEVWDPSNLNRYTDLSQFIPEYTWLINENPNTK